MNYSKPEITLLGEAAEVIQGKGLGIVDTPPDNFTTSDCELDD